MSNGVSGSIAVADGAEREVCGVHSSVAVDGVESGGAVHVDDDEVCGRLSGGGEISLPLYRARFGVLMA